MDEILSVADKSFKIMIDEATIAARLKELAKIITQDYADKKPVLIGVLNGCFLFMADLVKQLNFPCEIAFIKVSSYHGGMESTRQIKEDYVLTMDVSGRHLLLIEDIVDTGNTMRFVADSLQKRKPASVNIATLLFKPAALEHDLKEMNYVAFEIENKFVVGYGLDYKGLGRNLNAIYQLVP